MHHFHSPSWLENSIHEPLEIVYTDVWGPVPVSSIDGHCYYVDFVDGFMKFNWLFPIFHKCDALLIFKRFKLFVEKQIIKPIRLIQFDNG